MHGSSPSSVELISRLIIQLVWYLTNILICVQLLVIKNKCLRNPHPILFRGVGKHEVKHCINVGHLHCSSIGQQVSKCTVLRTLMNYKSVPRQPSSIYGYGIELSRISQGIKFMEETSVMGNARMSVASLQCLMSRQPLCVSHNMNTFRLQTERYGNFRLMD